MSKNIKDLLKALFAGILIGLAGTLYLSIKTYNLIVASLLFSFALLLICALNLNLYTGKVGYVFDKSIKNKPNIFLVILGNFLGLLTIALIAGFGIKDLDKIAHKTINIKINHGYLSAFLRAILCGFMMYLAVEGHKRVEYKFGKVLVVIFSVMIFILAGFEHSIANFYYMLVGLTFNLDAILCLLLNFIGNALGAISLHYLLKYSLEKVSDNKETSPSETNKLD